ncbi:maltokinase N-terminal cap-like domain-containing protein [Nocardia macrotermitis]|uniref:Maltokinase N-terminal cap domain-containing protein n=1 Tax=Nocardia macrotermitis TaxID=2585198 RepID=A0A7K0D8F2_9NOCA|nr:1,4-alpha-glucan branching protein [Nocardia macrotermitis]MQY22060.1 hypothetical protein [Nocardia macrotermitis]
MAVIHHTTLVPTKLELLRTWLPRQDWFDGTTAPELVASGGFRLDDPAGEVGIECYLATDTSTGRSYHVPMTYRGAPLPDAGAALIGTLEHGVLGRRWVYDGPGDPVFVAQALALLTGRARAQDQGRDNTPDPDIDVTRAAADTAMALRVVRVPGDGDPGDRRGSVSGPWRTPEGLVRRGVLLEAVTVDGRK